MERYKLTVENPFLLILLLLRPDQHNYHSHNLLLYCFKYFHTQKLKTLTLLNRNCNSKLNPTYRRSIPSMIWHHVHATKCFFDHLGHGC